MSKNESNRKYVFSSLPWWFGVGWWGMGMEAWESIKPKWASYLKSCTCYKAWQKTRSGLWPFFHLKESTSQFWASLLEGHLSWLSSEVFCGLPFISLTYVFIRMYVPEWNACTLYVHSYKHKRNTIIESADGPVDIIVCAHLVDPFKK